MIQETKFSNGGQVVCRDVVPVGSHLKERVCMTLAASKEESNKAKAVLDAAQQRRAMDAALQRSGGKRAEGP
jgi:hypothetical protein